MNSILFTSGHVNKCIFSSVSWSIVHINVICTHIIFLLVFLNISTGRWENDERNGKGTYRYVNGDVYEGEWKDNKRLGKGIYQCSATKLKVCYPLIKKEIDRDYAFEGISQREVLQG